MRFEIVVNGKRVCVAGQRGFGVLNTIVSWVKLNPAKHSEKSRKSFEEFCKEELTIHIGGVDSNDPETSFQTTWNNYIDEALTIGPGDEILVRILPDGDGDEPIQSTPKYRG